MSANVTESVVDRRGALPAAPGNSTIPGLLAEAVARFGDAPWAVFEETTHSFRHLEQYSREVAAALVAASVGPDHGVGLYMSNRLEWLHIEFGVARSGAWFLPVNTWLKQLELTHILRASGCRVLIWERQVLGKDTLDLLRALVPEVNQGPPGSWHSTEFPELTLVVGVGDGPWPVGVVPWSEFLAAGRAVAPDQVAAREAGVGPDSVAMVIYTSGTTGDPKGAVLRHTGVVDHMREWSRHLGLTSEDRSIMGSPLFWVFGCVSVALVPLLTGCPVVLHQRFDTEKFLASIHRHRISHLQGVPDQYEMLLNHPRSREYDLTSLRVVQMGGTKMQPTLPSRLLERAPRARMTTAYGLTECASVNTWTPFDAPFELLGTVVGKPAPDNEISLRNPETGEPVPPGEVGELWIRGNHVIREYHRNPAATAKAIVDGWFRTGDLGSQDEQGYITLHGRLAHVYKRGGMNVYPAEVEVLLAEHPAVELAAVIGVPDERLGQVGAAYVTLRPGAQLTPAELLAWATERIAAYKVPAYCRIVDELPMTASGKVRKHELPQIWSPDEG